VNYVLLNNCFEKDSGEYCGTLIISIIELDIKFIEYNINDSNVEHFVVLYHLNKNTSAN